MTKKEEIKAIVGEDKLADVMKLVNSSFSKYIQSDKGKLAKQRANQTYTSKVKAAASSPDFVRKQLSGIGGDPATLTCLWNHYRNDFVNVDKPTLTRAQYKKHLDELAIPIRNPHIRNGIKYYGPGYVISQDEDN
jgi:hypothetical protein